MLALLFLLAVALQLRGGLTVAVGHLRGLTVSAEDATTADSGYAAPLTSSGDLEREDGESSNQLDVEAGARRTRMQCLGSQTLTRACHFEDVYYDLRSSRFVHYGIEGATPDVFGDDQKRGEPWLRLVRCVRASACLRACRRNSASLPVLAVLQGQRSRGGQHGENSEHKNIITHLCCCAQLRLCGTTLRAVRAGEL